MNKDEVTTLVDKWIVSKMNYYGGPELTAENLVEVITLVMDNYESLPVKLCVKKHVVNPD